MFSLRRILSFFLIILYVAVGFALSENFDKGLRLISKSKYLEAARYFDSEFEKVRVKYLNVKNTRQPEKQKMLADEYCSILLGLAFCKYKLNETIQTQEIVKTISIFFDEHSQNVCLFQAYAMKLMAEIQKKSGNELYQQSYQERARKLMDEYKITASARSAYERKLKILLGEIY